LDLTLLGKVKKNKKIEREMRVLPNTLIASFQAGIMRAFGFFILRLDFTALILFHFLFANK
jgi:hypothetical protein